MEDSSAKGPILISEIHLQNLLSFGPDAKPIPLGPLNVLIGANGSGKSNLIEAIGLMRATPTENLRDVISNGGGINEWCWKRAQVTQLNIGVTSGVVTPAVKCSFPQSDGDILFHSLGIGPMGNVWKVYHETIGLKDYHNFMYARELAWSNGGIIQTPKHERPVAVNYQFTNYDSVLNHFRDHEEYPPFHFLQEAYGKIKIYREFHLGRNSNLRQPQRKNQYDDSLQEDFSNLALFLRRILSDKEVKENILKCLYDLYEGLTDIQFLEIGDWIEISLIEGDLSFPALRLSDGTLRYLCLIAILLDPTPPPLVCIEEPELGLHPDLIVKIADLLLDASTRTQLIVTTHSDIIIDVLTDHPEYVFVCEKENGSTSIERLDPEKLKPWLEDYRLGALWMRGFLGGNRW